MEIINHSYSQQEAAIARNAASCKVLVDGQPMRQRISLFLIVALLTSAVGAQVKVRDKGDAALRRAEAAQRKAQAIDILKGVVESAADIQELRTRLGTLAAIHADERGSAFICVHLPSAAAS